MRRTSFTRTATLLASFITATALLSGCAGSAESTPNPQPVTNGLIGEQPDGSDPTPGGNLSYATFSAVTSLDPANRQDSGTTGGTEMAAIYDLLVRYDPVAEEYLPQLAQSLETNADASQWTLTLRPHAKFSDGTPVDSAAVRWSIDRYLGKNGTQTQVWKTSVADMTAPDASTVVFTLQRPWRDFPIMLTSGPGMIVAPSSMSSGTFTAVGAGPFTVDKFVAQEELALAANPDYWDGKPPLDTLRFPVIQGEQPKLDALHTGGIDAAYLRRSDSIHNARTAGDIGYISTASLGQVGMINQRDGRAASDPRVRKAIVAAVDPALYNERAEAGYGMPGSEMFQSWSTWHGDVPADGYDPEAAKQYLAEAKANGYDGRLRYLSPNTPEIQKNALAFQAMLQAAGFTVDIDYAPTVTDYIRRLNVEHDYDVAVSGLNVLEESPFVRLHGYFHSTSPSNVMGYNNPKMDDLLTSLQSAPTDDDTRAVLDDLQTLVNETAPLVPLGAGQALVAWASDVHGIAPSADGIMLFGAAWKGAPSAK